jgi:hypothetical protein
MPRKLLLTIWGLGLLLMPSAALAAGGPVPAIQGGSGVTVSASPFKMLALAHGGNTMFKLVWKQSGTLAYERLIHGSFGVPAAAYDGSWTGLSADGGTLVLVGIPTVYPPRLTRLLILDPRSFKLEPRITLPGFFGVDAISPSGRWLYLIHYRRPATDPTDYEVRAYDLVTHRLLQKPVVDPREPGEKMQGFPITRTMSADGRWAYTLYGRPTGAPFIHALDTEGRTAFCVDLSALANVDLSSDKLVLGPATTLRVEKEGTPLALMDTRTFAVRSPAATAAPARSARRTRPSQAATSDTWTFAVPLLAVLIGVVLTAARRQRPRRDSDPRPTA